MQDGTANHFDSVVMLTASNWHTELRSNRYHYASRFARLMPVIFVQPDLNNNNYKFEEIDLENFFILHISSFYGSKQNELLDEALALKNIKRPLFWIYNPQFLDYFTHRYVSMIVYHATEDHFSLDWAFRKPSESQPYIKKLLKLFDYMDLLISVSDGVEESVLHHSGYSGERILVTNGCDYKFYEPDLAALEKHTSNFPAKRIVFYQGNIFDKLDYILLHKLVTRMPDWHFQFCGKVIFDEPEWQLICKNKNVEYLGLLSPEEIRKYAYQATVGIIPFVERDYIINKSLPLKAFEYLACGLPVVSVPIRALLPYSHVFSFARTPEEFEQKICEAVHVRYHEESLRSRLIEAKKHDYDLKFHTVFAKINSIMNEKKREKAVIQKSTRLTILILYDIRAAKLKLINEGLLGFNMYSEHNIYYVSIAEENFLNLNFFLFDVVVIYQVAGIDPFNDLPMNALASLKFYKGYKILVTKGECGPIVGFLNEAIHFHAIFADQIFIDPIHFNAEKNSHIELIQTPTRYMPLDFESNSYIVYAPPHKRSVVLGYRNKINENENKEAEIALLRKVQRVFEKMKLNVDFDLREDVKSDTNCYQFMQRCRVMLGGELESNSLFYPHDPQQIPYGIYEAIALKTALVLYEESYPDILKPHIHYIPLKKDLSNILEVIEKIKDLAYLHDLTEKAYENIIKSDFYNYKKFIEQFDSFIQSRVKANNDVKPLSALLGYFGEGNEVIHNPYTIKNFIIDEYVPLVKVENYAPPLQIVKEEDDYDAVAKKIGGLFIISFVYKLMPSSLRGLLRKILKAIVKTVARKEIIA